MTRSALAKALSGTTRNDRVRRLNGTEKLRRLPAPPINLPAHAYAAWTRIGGLALDAGVLTRFDTELLALAARTAASCDQLEAQLAAEGFAVNSRGALKTHPAASALDRSRGLLFRLLIALGLSPSAREKPTIENISKAPNKFLALDQMLSEDRINE